MTRPDLPKRKKLVVDADNLDDLRYRCQTDLFFLAHDVLGYDKLLPRVHQKCANFFVQKRPALPIEEQDEQKIRMFLYPRFSYKSTLNVADIIQWLACFPDVIIFPITAGGKLGNAFVDEVQQHLTAAPEGREPSILQQIFPELCVPQKDFLIGQYYHPARTVVRKEPSLFSLTPGMNISGFHCHVMKEDDVVNNVNSKTLNGLVGTRRDLAVTRDMLDPDGYNDRVGTTYSPLDANMQDLRIAQPGWIQLLRAPAWSVKPTSRWKLKDHPIDRPLPEEDYDFLFPEKLSYRYLCAKMIENFANFCAQYLLDPQGASGVTFTDEILAAATIPAASIRPYGKASMVWVLRGDSVAGVVGLSDDDKISIVDLVEGRFLPSQLVTKIVKTAQRWGIEQGQLLKTSEAVSAEMDIRAAAHRAGFPLAMTMIDDQPVAAVMSSVKSLESLMSSRRLLFSDGLPGLNLLYDSFQQYAVLEHKEIAEAVALLARSVPRHVEQPYITKQMAMLKRQEYLRELQNRETHAMAHGLGAYATPEPIKQEPAFEADKAGLPDDLPGLTA